MPHKVSGEKKVTKIIYSEGALGVNSIIYANV